MVELNRELDTDGETTEALAAFAVVAAAAAVELGLTVVGDGFLGAPLAVVVVAVALARLWMDVPLGSLAVGGAWDAFGAAVELLAAPALFLGFAAAFFWGTKICVNSTVEQLKQIPTLLFLLDSNEIIC